MSKYVTKFVCVGCKSEFEITEPDIKKAIEESYVDVFSTCQKCGAKLVGISAAEQAAKDDLFYCHAKKDYCMTEKCPSLDCDRIDDCHRRGFRKEMIF